MLDDYITVKVYKICKGTLCNVPRPQCIKQDSISQQKPCIELKAEYVDTADANFALLGRQIQVRAVVNTPGDQIWLAFFSIQIQFNSILLKSYFCCFCFDFS